MNLRIKRELTFWWFKLKEWTVGVNYVHGTRIPSDYPEYMWVNIGEPGKIYKYLSIEEQLKLLKEIYKDTDSLNKCTTCEKCGKPYADTAIQLKPGEYCHCSRTVDPL